MVNENHYNCLSKKEFEEFTEMFSVFHDLILSMIRNAVHVLPTDKTNKKPSATAHLRVNNATKHNQEYEKFIDIRDVFLSCFKSEIHRELLNKAIKHFTLKPNPEHKNDYIIKICIKSSFFITLNENSQENLKKDIKILEQIINKINDSFNKLLPQAQRQGMLAISKIRRIDIPEKAKYSGKQKEKGKGIE